MSLILLLVAVLFVRTAVSDDRLVAASGDEGAWVVAPANDATGRPELLHHAADMGGPYRRIARPLAIMPEALAAWDDRVWIIFPPRANGQRGVYSLRAVFNPAIEQYVYLPLDQLDIAEGLPADDRLVGFTGAPDGPVALIAPRGAQGGRVRRGERAAEAAPRLLQLRNRVWVELEAPPDLDHDRPCHLLVDAAKRLVIAGRQAGGDGSLSWFTLEETGWTRIDLPISAAEVVAVARVGDRQAIARTAGRDELEIAYRRPAGLATLARVPRPDGQWALLGLATDLVMLERTGRRELSLRRVGGTAGDVSEPELLSAPPVHPWSWLHMPLLAGLAITAVLLVFIFRPDASTSVVTLQPGQVIAPLGMRVLAFALDYGPIALVAVLVTGSDPRQLLELPMWSPSVERAALSAAVVGITVAHSTIGEAFFGRSVGKLVLGCQVVGLDGERPRIGPILVRNVFKLVLIMTPILGVFVFMNPNQQRLGDLVARTVVVRKTRPAPEEGAEDGEN